MVSSMREMKDSGIEWIGKIPEDWEICKLKNTSDIYTGNSIKDNEKGLYSDMNNAYPYIATKDIDLNTSSANYKNGMYTKKDDNNFKIAPKNSSLLCIEGGSAGKKITHLTEAVTFVNKLCCFTPKKINSKYQFYYLQSPSFISEFNLNMSGLIGGVSMGKLKEFPIINPPLEEQELIADYLDEKVQEIDNIISKTQETIEEYKKYRQSVITEAVTKGLNPNVEMKDSGIEWIGEIPRDWVIAKLKTLTTQIIDGTHSTPNYVSEGIPFLRVTDISSLNNYNTKIDFENVAKITHEEHNELIKRCKPEKGDLLVSKNGTIGVPKIVDWDCDFSIFVSLCLIKIKRNIDVNFLYYYFKSSLINMEISIGGKTGTITNLHLNKIREFNIPFPIKEEQMNIVNYLNKKCSQIDSLIAKKQQLITQLETYKKSLIYEYVTGKKEVALSYAY